MKYLRLAFVPNSFFAMYGLIAIALTFLHPVMAWAKDNGNPYHFSVKVEAFAGSYVGNPLFCVGTADDPDDDIVSYEYNWFMVDRTNDKVVSLPDETSQRLRPSQDLKEREVFCQAKATDGKGGERYSWRSAAVKIQNRAPESAEIECPSYLLVDMVVENRVPKMAGCKLKSFSDKDGDEGELAFTLKCDQKNLDRHNFWQRHDLNQKEKPCLMEVAAVDDMGQKAKTGSKLIPIVNRYSLPFAWFDN